MNMFIHELKSNRKTAIIWCVSLSMIAILFLSLFGAMAEDVVSFQNIIRTMPEAIQKLLGIYVDEIASFEGFYSFVFVYVVLCGAIQANSLGISIVSKEWREKTADFLMTKPRKRVSIFSYKLLASVIILLITNLIYIVVIKGITLTLTSSYSMKTVLMISVTLFFVQLIFLSFGILVATIVGKIKSVISISLSTVFGFFMLSGLGSILGEEKIRYLSPFQYFEPEYIIRNGMYESKFLFLGIFLVLGMIGVSYLVYITKDIPSVS